MSDQPDTPAGRSGTDGVEEALRGLPEAIAEQLRAAPIGVREVRNPWVRRLAIAGVVAAIGSAAFTVVSQVTSDNVVDRLAPVSRTADRVDRGITGVESALDRVRGGIDNATTEDPATPGRRVIRVGGILTITVEELPDGSRRTRIEGAD